LRAPTLAGSVLMVCGCATRPSPPPQLPTGARSQAPEELLMLPEGGDAPQLVVTPHVRYPGGERARATETVIVGFVVDTTGTVEYGTISFLQPARPALHKSVCNALSATRLSPGLSQGRPQRSLVVMPFSFAVLRDVLQGMPTFDFASYRRALANQPRDSIIAQLERAPRCS
jgi:hypothetical protein